MKIYGKAVPATLVEKIITAVQQKKYAGIPKKRIATELKKVLTNTPSLIEKLDKKKYQDQIVKTIRSTLYKSIGVFSAARSKEEHHSTKRRSKHVYQQIFSLTGKVKSIVDLGAGLHGLAYQDFGVKVKYTAYEINAEHVALMNAYFEKEHIKGKAIVKDVLTMQRFPKADVYFLFQLLDSLEQVNNHKISESLLKQIPSTKIVVSFSTLTLSGKPMNVPERRWFGLLTKRLGFTMQTIKTPTEVFHVLSR